MLTEFPLRRWLNVVIVPVAIVGLLFALLSPAVSRARDAARRSASRGHLKQLAVAIYNYEDVYGRLPPGGWATADDHELHGLVTVLFPYLDQNPLFADIDFTRPWHHPRNQPICRRILETGLYPHSTEQTTAEGYGLMHYAGNAHLFSRNSSVRLDDIPAGLSQTLLMGEAAGAYRPWASAWNWRAVGSTLNTGPDTFGHAGRAETDFVLADGQLKSLSSQIDPLVLTQLASGGRIVPVSELSRPPIPATYPSTRIRFPYNPPPRDSAGPHPLKTPGTTEFNEFYSASHHHTAPQPSTAANVANITDSR